uniref:Small ribosomal subunit protein uS11c n=1 Tax=Euglena clara TaxID=215708 RepID=A0A2Z4YVH1_9EUGL|nr:ribosomal protein S11 [Euglena clara]AXA45481.1 ribosomal protein S11 [Euglena clara]
MLKQKKLVVKNVKRKISRGVVHILKAGFNNTIISVTDLKGNVISWSSSGSCGFKGSRKGTPFAAQTATTIAVKKAIDQGIRQIEINVSGPGSGRETAIRSIQTLGLAIIVIKDVTALPHNGCRPSKKRRI